MNKRLEEVIPVGTSKDTFSGVHIERKDVYLIVTADGEKILITSQQLKEVFNAVFETVYTI
jgi:hypothetical protein